MLGWRCCWIYCIRSSWALRRCNGIRFHAWRSLQGKRQAGNADASAEQAWGSVAHPGGDRHGTCNRKETHAYSTAKAELSCCREKSSDQSEHLPRYASAHGQSDEDREGLL